MKRYLHLFAILLLHLSAVKAQKLPKIQTSSVRAPGNLKIDGKTTEWDGQFQAYNPGNHIYYTLSNDDNNLYLTVCMEDILGGKKIFKGGITFTIIALDKNAHKIAVTFPVIKKGLDLEGGKGNPLFVYAILKEDTVANKEKIDALRSSANSEIMKVYKEVQVTGIPEISGTYLSIYNPQNIMVGAGFDKKMRYTYELAIPLKYLSGAISTVKAIKYNIELNTLPPVEVISMTTTIKHDDQVVFPEHQQTNFDDMFFYQDTDISGVYTLAKKP